MVKYKTFISCAIYALLIASGCTAPPVNDDEDLSHIAWDSLENKDLLSETHVAVDFVKLETSDKCILNDIAKIEVDDSLLFIEDYMQRLYLFSKSGRFLYKIGTKGGAENEYVTLFDFILNREKKQVYIVDSTKEKLLVYDYKGRYIENRSIGNSLLSNSTMVAFADENHLVTINFNSPEERTNFSVIDIPSKTITNYVEYISIGNLRSSDSDGRTTYHLSNLLMCAQLSDTIYTYRDEAIKPLYVFQNGMRHATKDDINKGQYDFGVQASADILAKGISTGITDLHATDKIIYFMCRTKNELYRIFYDSGKNKGYKFDMTKNKDAAHNTLWNCLKTSSHDAFICALPVNDFFFREKVRCSYPELDSILNLSKEEDNPILAFFDVVE